MVCLSFDGRLKRESHLECKALGCVQVVEGSLDGSNWFELDCQPNRSTLVGLQKSATFSISVNEFIHMIRLRQTGKESSGHDCLTVSAPRHYAVRLHCFPNVH
jgi:hypothetical protein